MIAGTLSVTETVSWGIIYYAFSVLLVPMHDDLGWSAATLTGAFSVALLVSGIAAPFAGRWLDRHGPRALMTAGSILGVMLVLAWATVESIVVFYLIWAGLGLAMAATLYEPAFATVATWFERDRPRALLVITVAAGFASTIFLPLTGWLIETFGWRQALVVLAGILAILTVFPHAMLLRRRPEDLGFAPDGVTLATENSIPGVRLVPPGVALNDALRDPAFRWLTVSFFLETLSSIAIGIHLIPYLTGRGESIGFAATATGLIGAAQVGARVLATLFGGRISQVTLTALVFALQAVAVGVLLGWQDRAGILLAVVLLGAGRGVVTLMRPGLVADFYGRAHFGAINGVLALFLTGARSLAPVGAGVAFAITGSYEPVFWGLAAASLIAAGAMIQTGRARRVSAEVAA